MSTQVARMRDMWNDARAYSWESFLHTLDHGTINPAWRNVLSSADHGSWLERCDGFTYTQARDLAHGRNVWPDGRREVETIAREQASKIIRARRPGLDYLMDTTGQFFDVPSVVENRPESWLRPIVSDRGDRITIRFVVDVGVSAGVSPALVRQRSAAIAACVLTLQAQGAPVEVIAITEENGSGDAAASYGMAVHMNEPGRPIDVARLTALAHPTFLRRLMFRLQEVTPVAEHAARWGNGTYGYPRVIDRASIDHCWGKQAVFIPSDLMLASLERTIEAINGLIRARIGRKGTDDVEA